MDQKLIESQIRTRSVLTEEHERSRNSFRNKTSNDLTDSGLSDKFEKNYNEIMESEK